MLKLTERVDYLRTKIDLLLKDEHGYRKFVKDTDELYELLKQYEYYSKLLAEGGDLDE